MGSRNYKKSAKSKHGRRSFLFCAPRWPRIVPGSPKMPMWRHQSCQMTTSLDIKKNSIWSQERQDHRLQSNEQWLRAGGRGRSPYIDIQNMTKIRFGSKTAPTIGTCFQDDHEKYEICLSKDSLIFFYILAASFCLLLFASEPSSQRKGALISPVNSTRRWFYFCFWLSFCLCSCTWRVNMLTQYPQMVGAGCFGVRR